MHLFPNELCYAIKFYHVEDKVSSKISPDNAKHTQWASQKFSILFLICQLTSHLYKDDYESSILD